MLQNGLLPVHIAAMLGNMDMLKYLTSLPEVDAKAPVSTVNSFCFSIIVSMFNNTPYLGGFKFHDCYRNHRKNFNFNQYIWLVNAVI